MQNTSTAEQKIKNDATEWIVRCGNNAQLFRVLPGPNVLTRGSLALCRTPRGLEMGEVLAECSYSDREIDSFARATAVRLSRPEDQLLWSQLQKLSEDASNACQAFLESNRLEDVLVEVEPLFDGRTLFFHFLGEPSVATEAFVDELAKVYQKNVASSKFAELLEHGCGPGCGTKEKAGCGTSGGCAVCAIAGGCSVKK